MKPKPKMKRRRMGRRKRRAPIRVPKRSELGAPPGTVSPPPGAPEPRVRLLRYGPDECSEAEIEELGTLDDMRSGAPVCWIDFDGVGDSTDLRALAERFGWHPLVLEDVVSLHQRPKVEEYEDYVYLVVLMPGPEGLPLEQLSVLFGKDYVVTVQSGAPGDTLEGVRERIRSARGRIRGAHADYLAYAIVDAVVDHYCPVVDRLNARLEGIEGALGDVSSDLAVFSDIHAIRNDLHTTWTAVSATAEALSKLIRGEARHVSDATRLYLRDCQDHCAQLLDATVACRELSASLMELHQSKVSNQVGEGMRILTMIATIFIPMSFIAGVYGMNFDREASPLNMPELGWELGYPFALGLMFLVGVGFVAYFRRRGWLGSRSR